MFEHPRVIKINADNQVICDCCNKDYSESNKQGGAIMDNWAYCPECWNNWKNKEDIMISGIAECPSYLSFRDFIFTYREQYGK